MLSLARTWSANLPELYSIQIHMIVHSQRKLNTFLHQVLNLELTKAALTLGTWTNQIALGNSLLLR